MTIRLKCSNCGEDNTYYNKEQNKTFCPKCGKSLVLQAEQQQIVFDLHSKLLDLIEQVEQLRPELRDWRVRR